jgi:hypothetical protein
VSDRCAACFAVLKPAHRDGGRYACLCHPPNNFRALRGRYWSEAIPEPPHTMEACLPSKQNRPTLHLYGSKP